MHRALLMLLLALGMALRAEKPVIYPAGDAAEFRLHWRVKPAPRDSARWGMAWNIADSANYDALEARLADSRYADAFGREEAWLRHVAVSSGRQNVVAEYKLTTAGKMRSRGCSMRLRRRAGASEATLEIGSGMPEITLNIKLQPGTGACAFAGTPVDTLVHEWSSVMPVQQVFAPFPDVDSLRSHIRGSDDPGEAEWVLYDVEARASQLEAGGNYRIATVADGRGGYDMIYLDGATVNEPQWQPMRLKGRLRATGFNGHYELSWLDAFGDEMPAECGADIEGGSLLVLYFPGYDAQLRFRRVITADN